MADDDLVRVLSEIQRRGAIGRTPLPDAIAHSERFVAALPVDTRTVVDFGSGGGLPALVIAARRPDLRVVMIERRTKRADLLRYGARALGLDDTVTVYDGDVATYAVAAVPPLADVVTARSFGPLATVLQAARPIVRPLGSVLVSTHPTQDAAQAVADGRALGFEDLGVTNGIQRFRMFHVEHSDGR